MLNTLAVIKIRQFFPKSCMKIEISSFFFHKEEASRREFMFLDIFITILKNREPTIALSIIAERLATTFR